MDSNHPSATAQQLEELRTLLFGPQEKLFRTIAHRINDPDARIEDISQYLAEAIQLRNTRDNRLRVALLPTVEEAIKFSVQRNPGVLAEALFPVLGSAIRKAIAAQLQAMMDSLNQSLEAGFSVQGMKWRLEALRTGRPFGEIMLLRSSLYRVRDLFLIHRATGVLLLHRGAAATVRDPQLVSAMLTAIQDFVRDSFTGFMQAGGQQDLETIQAGEFTLWIQHGPNAVLAGVVEGVAPRALRSVLQDANERFHREFATELARFDGDPEPLEKAHPLLDSCLLGQADIARRQATNWWAWGLAATVLLAGIAATAWLAGERMRFGQLVEQVRRQEGVVMTGSGRLGWNRYFIEGLKDPLSADLGRYQVQSGLAADQVEWRWRPYASLEPALVARREIGSAADALSAIQVKFDRNSSRPSERELDEAAAAIRRLDTACRSAGRYWRVTVVGDFDAGGDAAGNYALAQQRADRIRAGLVDRGLAPDRLFARAADKPVKRIAWFEVAHL